jgi:hypothetical protein
MESMRQVLTLWKAGLIPISSVVAWADEEILRTDHPTQELLDLSLDGPEQCLKRAEFEFPVRPVDLNYATGFAFHAVSTALESYESCRAFANWSARFAIGENLDVPEVVLGYQLDHFLDDCGDDAAAVALVRDELPRFLPNSKEIVTEFVAQIPNLKFDTDTRACRSTGRYEG